MINCKEIEKKTCVLCGNNSINDGIIIMKKFFCENCVSEITQIDVNDEKYEIIKARLKSVLFVK